MSIDFNLIYWDDEVFFCVKIFYEALDGEDFLERNREDSLCDESRKVTSIREGEEVMTQH